MPEPEPIRVAAADGHPIHSLGLRHILEREPDLALVGEATDRAAALRVVRERRPDVLVVGMNLPAAESVALAQALAEVEPRPRIVALSENEEARLAYEMLASGAAAYLTKEDQPEQIVQAIRDVAGGRAGLLSPLMEARLRGASRAARPEPSPLTQREREVLELLALGYQKGQIAERLSVSPETVRNHIAHIYDKLDLHHRGEAVAWAWRHGLVGPG